jgi:hypothetical protein
MDTFRCAIKYESHSDKYVCILNLSFRAGVHVKFQCGPGTGIGSRQKIWISRKKAGHKASNRQLPPCRRLSRPCVVPMKTKTVATLDRMDVEAAASRSTRSSAPGDNVAMEHHPRLEEATTSRPAAVHRRRICLLLLITVLVVGLPLFLKLGSRDAEQDEDEHTPFSLACFSASSKPNASSCRRPRRPVWACPPRFPACHCLDKVLLHWMFV